MKNTVYEKPVILPHTTGLANKFGHSSSRHTMTNIDGVSVTKLIQKFGSPLFVFSEQRMRQRYSEAHRDSQGRSGIGHSRFFTEVPSFASQGAGLRVYSEHG
jgi:hypothetical protein